MPTRKPIPEWMNKLPRHLNRPFAYVVFGDTIARKRKEKNLNQEQLAQRAGISRNYLSQIERDKANNMALNVFLRLARALEIDEHELLTVYILTQVHK